MQAFDCTIFDKSLSHNVKSASVIEKIEHFDDNASFLRKKTFIPLANLVAMTISCFVILLHIPVYNLGTITCFIVILGSSHAHYKMLVSLSTAVLAMDGLSSASINIALYIAVFVTIASKLYTNTRMSVIMLPVLLLFSTLTCVKLLALHHDRPELSTTSDFVFLIATGLLGGCLLSLSKQLEFAEK